MEILGLITAVGTTVSTINGIIQLINNVKPLLRRQGMNPFAFRGHPPSGWPDPQMQSFRPQQHNPFGQGQQWMPGLRWVAQAHGNPWVPSHTRPFYQINLTGVWGVPPSLRGRYFIRQFGPYLNVILGLDSETIGYGEGLFNSTNGCLHIVGFIFLPREMAELGVPHYPFQIYAQLYDDWTIDGTSSSYPSVPEYSGRFTASRVA